MSNFYEEKVYAWRNYQITQDVYHCQKAYRIYRMHKSNGFRSEHLMIEATLPGLHRHEYLPMWITMLG